MKNIVDFNKFKEDYKNLDKDFTRFSRINYKLFRLHENLICNYYKQIYYLVNYLKWIIEVVNLHKINFESDSRGYFAEWLRELADEIEVQA